MSESIIGGDIWSLSSPRNAMTSVEQRVRSSSPTLGNFFYGNQSPDYLHSVIFVSPSKIEPKMSTNNSLIRNALCFIGLWTIYFSLTLYRFSENIYFPEKPGGIVTHSKTITAVKFHHSMSFGELRNISLLHYPLSHEKSACHLGTFFDPFGVDIQVDQPSALIIQKDNGCYFHKVANNAGELGFKAVIVVSPAFIPGTYALYFWNEFSRIPLLETVASSGITDIFDDVTISASSNPRLEGFDKYFLLGAIPFIQTLALCQICIAIRRIRLGSVVKGVLRIRDIVAIVETIGGFCLTVYFVVDPFSVFGIFSFPVSISLIQTFFACTYSSSALIAIKVQRAMDISDYGEYQMSLSMTLYTISMVFSLLVHTISAYFTASVFLSHRLWIFVSCVNGLIFQTACLVHFYKAKSQLVAKLLVLGRSVRRLDGSRKKNVKRMSKFLYLSVTSMITAILFSFMYMISFFTQLWTVIPLSLLICACSCISIFNLFSIPPIEASDKTNPNKSTPSERQQRNEG